MGKAWVIILILIYFILLITDIGLNLLLGWIPWVGAVLETISESIIEFMSAIIVIILAIMAGKSRNKKR